jgi:hypothetical protein
MAAPMIQHAVITAASGSRMRPEKSPLYRLSGGFDNDPAVNLPVRFHHFQTLFMPDPGCTKRGMGGFTGDDRERVKGIEPSS